MLTIDGLNVSYGDSQVLWDVHLNVPPGQVVCLLGRNGVGKTTLLKSIMGLLTPRSGRSRSTARNSRACPLTSAPDAVWATCPRGAISSLI